MITDLLYNRQVIGDLQKSMDAYSLRQKVLTNNIVNVTTPGYRAMKVDFEEQYKASLYPVGEKAHLDQTHEKHIQPENTNKSFKDVFANVNYKNSPLNDSGLNNVDIDKEMAELAENALRYEMSTKLMNKKFTNLRKAISGRV
ncbi:MAG: flagellar basal body rod protein FlgB [Candidatus Cloacimonetes bacterium]|nr:flagellar basal body rod protein FlgB [Candidatus Cloacimonadota bacterium]